MARKGLLRQSNKPKAQNTPHKIKGIIRQKKAEQKKKAKSSSLFSSLGLQAKANSTEPILRQTNSETILAKDSAVVHLSGAETITGNKTFRGAKIILEPSNPTGNYSFNELDNEEFVVGNNSDYSEYRKEEISYYTNAQNSIMKFPSGGKTGTIVLDGDLSGYVKTTGDQSISGVKKFENGARFHSDLFAGDAGTTSTVVIEGDTVPALIVSGNMLPMVYIGSNYANWSSIVAPGGISFINSKNPLDFNREFYFGLDNNSDEWTFGRRIDGDVVNKITIPSATCAVLATMDDIPDTSRFIPYTPTSGILVGNPDYSEAPGNYAIGLGSAVHATGQNSVALGSQASALALNAVAIGGTSLAKSTGSLAMNGGKAYGAQSIAIGAGTEASGNFSYAIGRTAKANDIYALALGGLYNQSDAKYSITMGFHSRAYPQSQHSFTWNGNTSLGIQNEYAANGGGTFNINPSAGTSGFYIGTKNLATILREQDGFIPTSGGVVTDGFKLINGNGYNILSGTTGGGLAVGSMSTATEGGNTAVGPATTAIGYDNTAIGCCAEVGKPNGGPGPDGGAEELAIGAYSQAIGGLFCVQIGTGRNTEPYSLKVFSSPILKSKSGSNYNDFEVVCPVSGYLPLTGGEVSGDVNEEIDWPYIRMENVLLQDESDGTSNRVLVNISIEATSAELNIGRQTGDCPSPITVNTEIVGVTGTPSEFPFDIAALSGEKQVPYIASDHYYEYTNGNSQIEIYIEQTGAISYYFATSDDEHYYGTESIPPTETTKKISSRFITEAEIDSKIKSGGAAFDRWRKGNTIYAGTGSDHLSAGTSNGVFIGSNQTITDGKGNSVVIGSNAKSNGGSNTIIGYGANSTGTGIGNVMIGYNARNTTNQGYSVSIGYGAISQYYGIAIGDSADANKENAVSIGWKTNCRTAKDIAIGREAQTSGGDGNYSNIAIGAWSKVISPGSVSLQIGGGTTSGGNSVGIWGNAYGNNSIGIIGTARGDNIVQLGTGTNSTSNTMQFLSKRVIDSAGKLYQDNVDIENIYQKKVLLESIIGDSSNPASTVEISEDYNIYQFWVGSNGTFPTFTFSFPNFSSTQARFQFTLLVHVDSGATTLTGPSGWVWVSGAGLPSSGFAGKAIWISGLKRTNDPTEPPLVSCWRCA